MDSEANMSGAEMPEDIPVEPTEAQPEQEGGYTFYKGKTEDAPESPEVVIFRPSKEHYDDPNEFIQEYQNFVENNVQEGQAVQISREDALKMAAAQQTLSQQSAETVSSEKEDDDTWFEAEKQLAKMDRGEVLEVLLSVGIDSLVYLT